MPIELHCDGCERRLRVADTLAGKTVKCPHCQTRKTVPGGAEEALTPAPRRPASSSPGRAAPVSPVAKLPARRPPAQPAPRARTDGKGKAGVPWFMYLIAALPMGILALAIYHGAAGSGPPWGGSMRLVWVGLGSGSVILVMSLARLPSLAVGIKVGVGLTVGALDYVVLAVVLLANRDTVAEPPQWQNQDGGQQPPAIARGPNGGQQAPPNGGDGGQPAPPGKQEIKPPPPALPVLPEETGPFRAHVQPLRWMALSPGGETLATAAEDGFVMLWDVSTGKRTGGFPAHKGGAGRVVFSADGKLLATLGPANEAHLKVWNVGETQPRLSADETTGSFTGLAFVQEGRLVVTAREKHLRLFNVVERQNHVFLRLADDLHGMALGRGGKTLFVGDGQKRVLQVDTDSWKVDRVAYVCRGGIAEEVAVSPENTFLAMAAAKGLTVIHLGTHRRRLDFDRLPKEPVAHVSFSPDGKRLAFVQGGAAIVWDLQRARMLSTITEPSGIQQALFHPDGAQLIVRNDREVRTHVLAR